MKYIFILHIIAQVEYGHAWYGKFFCRIGQIFILPYLSCMIMPVHHRHMCLAESCLSMMLCRYNADKPSYIGGVVNYLRLSVTVGKPVRMFL